MEGWPDGWACFGEVGASERFVNAGDRYVLYGEREGCRRAAWAITGGAVAVDREALAKALHDAFMADGRGHCVWGDRSEDTCQGYLAEADEAIRLLVGAAKPAKALYDEIEELRRRNAALTATANAAIERAEKAEGEAARLQDHLTSAERGREDFRKAYNAAIDDGNASVRRLTETANAAVARAEEAQLRAQQAEEERDVLRDYDSPFEQDAEDLRAEVRRLRRTLDLTAKAAAHLTTVISEMAGGDDA